MQQDEVLDISESEKSIYTYLDLSPDSIDEKTQDPEN